MDHTSVYQFTQKLQCPPQSLTILVIRLSKLLHSGVVKNYALSYTFYIIHRRRLHHFVQDMLPNQNYVIHPVQTDYCKQNFSLFFRGRFRFSFQWYAPLFRNKMTLKRFKCVLFEPSAVNHCSCGVPTKFNMREEIKEFREKQTVVRFDLDDKCHETVHNISSQNLP